MSEILFLVIVDLFILWSKTELMYFVREDNFVINVSCFEKKQRDNV